MQRRSEHCDLLNRDLFEISFLGPILSQQSFGVLVETALPRIIEDPQPADILVLAMDGEKEALARTLDIEAEISHDSAR